MGHRRGRWAASRKLIVAYTAGIATRLMSDNPDLSPGQAREKAHRIARSFVRHQAEQHDKERSAEHEDAAARRRRLLAAGLAPGKGGRVSGG